MHSSRIRTGCSLTVCQSLLPSGCLLWGVSALGGCLLWGVSAPGGCLPQGCLLLGGVCSWGVSAPRGVSVPGGVYSRGCLLWGGGVCSRGVGVFLLPGGVCSWGVSAPGGVCSGVCLLPRGVWYPNMHWGRHVPPVDRITDACKNITLATTSLRPVQNPVGLH